MAEKFITRSHVIVLYFNSSLNSLFTGYKLLLFPVVYKTVSNSRHSLQAITPITARLLSHPLKHPWQTENRQAVSSSKGN
ncbi:hypothetical protein [Nostoc sp.]|uniref:hypothetical protein n=1 Tax=Nostoc sp. TaxID=1180 RepID=UPI002FF835DE